MYIRDDFIKAIKSMTENPQGLTCFALALIEEIIMKAHVYNDLEELPAAVACVEHPLPGKSDGFLFLPLADTHDVEDHYNISDLAEWLNSGRDVHSFKYAGNSHITDNISSHLIKKISDIAEQFSLCLKKISEGVGQGIPMISLISMLSIMTCYRSRLAQRLLPNPLNIDDDTMEAQDYIALPSNIQELQRGKYILKINRAIYDLLEEAIVVFMIAGIGENWAINDYIKNDPAPNVSQIKDFLRGRTCCARMDQNLFGISSMDGIAEYVNKEYMPLYYLSPYLDNFIGSRINIFAEEKAKLRSSRVPETNMPVYIDDLDLSKVAPSLIHPPKTPGGKVLLADDDEWYEDISRKKPTDLDVMDFEGCIREKFNSKFYPKTLDTYELVGASENIWANISVIINNCSESVLESEGSKVPGLNMSYRSGRRYKEQLKSGGIAIDKEEMLDRMIDLRNEKSIIQKHQKPGYLSQNELIKKLTNEEYIRECGFAGKLYGRTTLMKKIRKLTEEGKIGVTRDANGAYFNENDLKNIIGEIYAI